MDFTLAASKLSDTTLLQCHFFGRPFEAPTGSEAQSPRAG
jgi:hypothetical protein